MKTLVSIITISLFTACMYAQEEQYNAAMQNALALMDQASEPEQLLESSGHFERIATAEKNRWIPYYYASHCLVMMSFNETNGEQKELVLDRAQEMLDTALELNPEESELHVLQAFLYPGRIMVDPVSRGASYMELTFLSLETAKQLNPANPRIYFLEGTYKINIPASMGGGAEAAKPILAEAMARFESFDNPTPFWPSWGEEATRTELAKLQKIQIK